MSRSKFIDGGFQVSEKSCIVKESKNVKHHTQDSLGPDSSVDSLEDDFPIEEDTQIDHLVQKIKNMTCNNSHKIHTDLKTKKEK